MSRAAANVNILSDTFEGLILKTNELLSALSTEIVTANTTVANTGNSSVNRVGQLWGTFGANTLVATNGLRGGNVSTSGTLPITSNVSVSGITVLSGNLVIDTDVLFVDIVNNRVGINNAAPTHTLSVNGTTNITGNVTVGGDLTVSGTTNITGSSNNASFLGGQPNSFYTNATNMATGTLPHARLPANVVNTSANFTITGVHTHTGNTIFSANVTFNANAYITGVVANGSIGSAGQVLSSNGTSTYWTSLSAGSSDYRTPEAQYSINGGGTVTWNGTHLKWGTRILIMPVEKTEFAAGGQLVVDCPLSGTVAYYDAAGSLTTATCTASGIPMAAGDALFYRVTLGMSSGSDQTKFLLVNYQNGNWSPAEGWVMIAAVNGDGANIGHVKFLPGQVNLPTNGSTVTYNVGTGKADWEASSYHSNATNLSTGTVAMGRLLVGNGVISASISVNGNTGITVTTDGVFVNSTYIATISSNNASFLGGQAAASYLRNTGTYTISGVHNHTANLQIAGLLANGTIGTAGQFLSTNGSVAYWTGVNVPLTTSTTLGVVDVGKCTSVSGTVTVPNSTFAAGDIVSIYNNSASSITITASITTLRLAGTTTTGNRTLSARGMATIWFLSSTEGIISGSGLS